MTTGYVRLPPPRQAVPANAQTLAKILARFPDGRLVRIRHLRSTGRATTTEWICQSLYEPIPNDPESRYRCADSGRLQYTGRRLPQAAKDLDQIKAELAEENAEILQHEPAA